MKTPSLAFVIVLTSLLSLGTAGGQVPEYTPDQALSMLDQRIRSVLGFKNPGQNLTDQPSWLSLTYVGLEVPKDDQKLINIIAVQCPPARNELLSYSTARRLDQVYELMLNNASLSIPTVTISGLKEAREVLIDPANDSETSRFKKYREYQKKWRNATKLFDEAKARSAPQSELAILNTDIQEIVQDWSAFGFKSQVEKALDTLMKTDANGSMTNTQWRRELLAFYRNLAEGANQGMTTNASIAIPQSTLHPAPEFWNSDAGWTSVKFKKEDAFSQTEDEYSKQTRYGSAGGGFLFWRVGGSASSTTETSSHHEVRKASQVSYEFQVRRAIINRPWLDQRFFFEPGFWTWNRPNNVPQETELPRVSKGHESGFPVDNANAKYRDAFINIPMIPSEVVVARKLKLIATVSKEDFDKIERLSQSSADVSGRAFFFFRVGGGGTNTSKLTRLTTVNDKVTFELSFEGPVVIGYISNITLTTPEPKKDGREWPAEAWGAK